MTAPNERRGAHADASEDEQAMYLLRMQERLAALSTEAGSIRAQLPHEYEQDVESIQRQMEILGDRLAELNAGSPVPEPAEETLDAGWAAYCDMTNEDAGVMTGQENRVSPAEMKFEQSNTTASSSPLEPADLWDEASVAELVRLYESGEARFGAAPMSNAAAEAQQSIAVEASAPSSSTENEQGDSASFEPTRLEQRFADIAQRIEQSLSEIRPESSLMKLGHRFDQLEERICSALDGMATRTDVEKLRRAEVQVEEISTQLGEFRTQLSRLDTIDTHLGTLTQQLSDERFSQLMASPATTPSDIEETVASAAEQMADRFANHERWETQARDLGEVRGLVENLINERRINDENNASILETMQQAIIRVLDRIDALEPVQQSTVPTMLPSEPVQQSAVPTMLPSEPVPADTESVQTEGGSGNDDAPSFVPVTSPQAGAEMMAEQMPTFDIETQQSSYESLTHPQSEPDMEPETATSSLSEAQDSTYVSLTHPNTSEPESSQVEAIAASDDEMMYEPPPFLRIDKKPSSAEDADDCQDQPYTLPGSQLVSDESPLASSAFFGDTSKSELKTENEESAASEPRALSINQMRQKLIAEAHRAKLRAESERYGTAGSEDSNAANDADESGKSRRRSRKLAGMTMPSAGMSTRSIVVGVVVLLLLVPAIFFLLRGSTSDPDGISAPEAVHSIPAPQGEAGSWNGIAPKQTNKVRPGAGQNGETDTDSGGKAPVGSSGRVDTASIPHGIMLLEKRALNADEIERAQQAQGMAFLSNQLGQAAANVTPASLMQEYILTQHSGPNKANGQASASAENSAKLPPATVGPFSLRLAAAKGFASAQFEVASRLAKGDVTEQNLKAAVLWYQRSASQGFALAQYRLGTLYERGLGVKADIARAQIWYRRAAQQGNLKAMHNLAVLSAGGERRTADYTSAAQWFLQASERGLADSQYNLAMLYESGLGVPHDAKEAYKWLVLASKSGDEEAKRHLKTLRTQLSKRDRAEAEKLARRWRAKASDPMANDAGVAGQAWQYSAQRASRG